MAKTRPESRLARLKGRVWGGMPAEEYLLIRLDGEDGEKPWTNREAADKVAKKIGGPKLSEQTISRWATAKRREVKAEQQYQDMLDASVSALARQAESGLSVDDLTGAQIILTIGKVHDQEGVDQALEVIKAFTALKRANTADRDSRQSIREYEESVAHLKETIEALRFELKRQGGDPDKVNQLNTKTVKAIDRVILAGRGRGK